MDPSYNNNPQKDPLANPYLNDQQQPQISNSAQNLNELDQGWFQCYKVALGVGVLLVILQFLTIFKFDFYTQGYYLYCLLQGITTLSSMALVVIQFLAMKDRDLQKAKIALLGFLGYVPLELLVQFIFYLYCFAYGGDSYYFPVILLAILSTAVYSALTLIGSFKVYQLLNTNQIKSDSDNYQNYYAA